jgi:hypothetical protein
MHSTTCFCHMGGEKNSTSFKLQVEEEVRGYEVRGTRRDGEGRRDVSGNQ